MTKIELIKMGQDFYKGYYNKYSEEITETYKYRGEIRTRTKKVLTTEGKRVQQCLKERAFRCPNCGRLVSWNELECWVGETVEDFLNDEVPCSICYENYMGEDL